MCFYMFCYALRRRRRQLADLVHRRPLVFIIDVTHAKVVDEGKKKNCNLHFLRQKSSRLFAFERFATRTAMTLTDINRPRKKKISEFNDLVISAEGKSPRGGSDVRRDTNRPFRRASSRENFFISFMVQAAETRREV